MYRDNENEQELINEFNKVVEQSRLAEIQFEEYCRLMKEMMLQGSTNN